MMHNAKVPSRIFIPIILLVLGVVITGILAVLFFAQRGNELERAFENESNQITSLVDGRMSLYTNVLYGAQGLFAASDFVGEEEWGNYVRALNLAQNYRGISSMLYIQDVPAADIPKLTFKVYPFTEKDEYFPIAYIARSSAYPATGSATSTIGFDISSEVGRRSALLAASSTRQPSATPVVQSVGTVARAVFSIYMPVYSKDASPNAHALGYVAASFRVKELFDGLAADPLFDRDIDVTITDVNGSTLLDTSASRSRTPTYSNRIYNTTIMVGGREWTLHFRALSTFTLGTFADNLPILVIIFGVFLSSLLAIISYLFIVSRERAIAARSLQLDALIKNFPYGVLVEDEGRVLYANERMLALFGLQDRPEEAFIGKSTSILEKKILAGMTDASAFEKEMHAVASSNVIVMNQKVTLRDGKVVARDYVPLFAEGKHIGAIWIAKDITEEENIDRMKTEFVSLASHQLRTPLTSIKWYTELLGENAAALDPEQVEYVHEITEATERMNDLVVALLDISRLDLGTFIIEPTPEDLVAVMQSSVNEQIPTIEKKKQIFSFTHAEGLPKVPVDRKLFFIITQNLVSNAMKYSPEGASIHLSLERATTGAYVVSCADTGYGIPAKDQSNIFKKLFRADNIRTLDVEGTGLGLYMIKTIAEAANCVIAFTSTEGKGTTFTFTIPAEGMKAKSGTKTLGE